MLFGWPAEAQKVKGAVTTIKSFEELHSSMLNSSLQRTIGRKAALSLKLPPLTTKIIVREGVPLTILPKQALQSHIAYLEKNQISLPKIHLYVKELQPNFDNQENFFETLVRFYYDKHFNAFTSHLKDLFHKVGSLNNPELEQRFLARMQQLVSYKDQVASKFSRTNDIRIRYINDIETLTAENFREEDLMLSIEQPLRASTQNTPCRHIKGDSTFDVGKQGKTFRVHNYNGPAEYLPHLYRYLVNGTDTKMQMFLKVDTAKKHLLLFNYDLSVWIRITPHEYGRPDRLHIHLHKKILQDFVLDGKRIREPMLINLSIPIKKPAHMHSLTEQELYRMFIETPLQQMRNNPYIQISTR